MLDARYESKKETLRPIIILRKFGKIKPNRVDNTPEVITINVNLFIIIGLLYDFHLLLYTAGIVNLLPEIKLINPVLKA